MNPKHKTVDVIKGMMSEIETDVTKRNTYINRRYDVVYGDGLINEIVIKSGFDRTPYNYLPRVVDIHAAQLFGRMPQLVTTYDKEDTGVFDVGVTDPEAAKTDKEKARLRNSRRAADAAIRNEAIKNIMRDNDFDVLANRAAVLGSYSGISVIKGWLDKKAKTYRFSLLETPQNYARYWSNSNFREHDAEFYMYQISVGKAKRDYGKFLDEDEDFVACNSSDVWWKAPSQENLERHQMKKVWVVEATGYFRGITMKNGKLAECEEGEEKPLNVLIVGDRIVQAIDTDLPEYWVINNDEAPGEPWGRSDISDDLIAINQTMIETMSDWRTASWKVTFPKMKYIGFDELSMAAFAPTNREAQGFPMDDGQDIQPINIPNTLSEFPRLMETLWDAFTKKARVSRVMLDDPTINPASNQGLMTTMKPLIDVTEAKQKRWESQLVKMFDTALKAVAKFNDTLKEAIEEEEFTVQVKWPSVFRREDATYQQMYNNRWIQGTISPESYLEAMGEDAGEEIDRIRDAMTDPTRAAMIGRALPMMAQQLIQPPASGAPAPKVSVNLRGDLTPGQEAALATQQGFNPTGEMGPQGNQGMTAYENLDNQGFLTDNPFNGGMPIVQGGENAGSMAANQPAPTLTPDQNQGAQTVSQPGSGAPAVTPEGAIAQDNQRRGA